jgi:hypothetical protein
MTLNTNASPHLVELEKDSKDIVPETHISEDIEDSHDAALKKVIRKVSSYSAFDAK